MKCLISANFILLRTIEDFFSLSFYLKMNRNGPDGSLCRITSSIKDVINNVKIVKVPDSVPSYKLLIIRTIQETQEESEKSDEELSDDELFNIKLPLKNIEKEKVADNKIAKVDKLKETVSEGVMRERNHHNRYQPYHKKNSSRYYGHRNKNFNNLKTYKSHSNREENYNYVNRDLNSRTNRDFNSTANKDFNSAASRDFSLPANQEFNSTFNQDFSSAPNHNFNSPSNRDFNSVPNQDFSSAPNTKFSSASNPDFNSPSNRDFNSSCNRDLSTVSNRDFDSAPKRNFNSAPKRDFNTASKRCFNTVSKQGFNSARGRKFNSASKRDFSLTGNNHETYNTVNYQHSLQHTSDDFSPQPWINPAAIFSEYSHAALPENPRSSVGLLGDHPSYAPSLPMFQSNKQTDNYICSQNSTYTPMSSNFQSDTISDNFVCDQASPYPIASNFASNNHNNSFVNGQNYWNDSYDNYSKSNQHRSKHFNNKNKRSWNKKSRSFQNVRNKKTGNKTSFDYRK